MRRWVLVVLAVIAVLAALLLAAVAGQIGAKESVIVGLSPAFGWFLSRVPPKRTLIFKLGQQLIIIEFKKMSIFFRLTLCSLLVIIEMLFQWI